MVSVAGIPQACSPHFAADRDVWTPCSAYTSAMNCIWKAVFLFIQPHPTCSLHDLWLIILFLTSYSQATMTTVDSLGLTIISTMHMPLSTDTALLVQSQPQAMSQPSHMLKEWVS